MDADYSNLVRGVYRHRASTYDNARGGWHVKLGRDFVGWAEPQPGEIALDLACGTGLVTLPMAMKVGQEGKVVAVDLTGEMIDEGRKTLASLQATSIGQGIAPISWIEADIASESLLDQPAITQVLDNDGGFDMITICSALVLLREQQKAMRFWVRRLLKTGGRVIVDVPDESPTLQFLMTYHLPVAMGLSGILAMGRLWVESPDSLAEMLEAAGLTVERTIHTNSYIEQIWHDSDGETALEVLKDQLDGDSHEFVKAGKLPEACEVWPEIWKKATRKRPDGGEGVEEAHRLYVCVGKKTRVVLQGVGNRVVERR